MPGREGIVQGPSVIGSVPPRRRARIAGGALLAAALLPTLSAAEEPRSAGEPRVMRESADVTQVVDAWDDGDPFDVSIRLGYESASKNAVIRRETHINEPGLTTGGFTSRRMDVANYEEVTTRLQPRIDVGLYKDLAVYFRLPIILSNTRSLAGREGDNGVNSADRQNVVLEGGPYEGPLFTLPFEAPERSGLEYLAIGLDLNVFNQARDRTKPTMLLGVEGRFSVSEPMHACTARPKAGQVECAHPHDVDRDGTTNLPTEGVRADETREPGVSRGTTGLEAHIMVSKRIKYIEPYGGFAALFEFQTSDSDFGLSDFQGSLVNHPPLVGTMTLGLQAIPWENREMYSRIAFDFRFTGEYHSEGRDYSELFDALGSSDSPTLRNPTYARFRAAPNDPGRSIVDESSERVYFTGLTDVQQYGSYRGSASASWQAAEYFKLQAGVGYRYDQPHAVTQDQPCNPDFHDDVGAAGPCSNERTVNGGVETTATGIPNPNYRAVINNVGRRFYVDESFTFDAFVSGTLMF